MISKIKPIRLITGFCVVSAILIIIIFYSINNGVDFRYVVMKYKLNSGNRIFNLWNSSIYDDNEMTPKQLWIHNSNISFPEYADKNFSKDCSIPHARKEFFDILKFWTNLTAEHDIPWWVTYGSLIGALRHKDMIPWDHDVDIAMPNQFVPLIRKLSTKRKDISSTKINIITRPGEHCPYNGKREDCNGKSVTSQTDGCAFCGPVARIFYSPNRRTDVYLIDIEFHEGRLQLAEEGTFEYMASIPHYPIDWYFPLRNCSFMGLTLQCPRKSETVLTDYYKSYAAKSSCVKGKWV